MNFLKNITVEEGPHTPDTIVTGKPQLMSLNAVFQVDGYDEPASATGKWLIRRCRLTLQLLFIILGFPAMQQAGGHENNKTVEDKGLHAAQEPPVAPPDA